MKSNIRLRSCVTALALAACLLSVERAHAQTAWPTFQAAPTVAPDATKDAALIVGVDEYMFVPHVEGAAATARDWFTFLVEGEKLPISRAHLLRNRDATREQILDAAKRVASEVEPGGKLWIVFIGHGAPAADGKDGVLVGVDAQQSASSLYARSIAQKELLAAVAPGAQAQTILVVDACFSGRTASGAPLAAGLQPLIPVTDTAAADRTTILSAGKSDQFAGPLPGTNRPAFSYLVLGALRGWADKNAKGEVTAQDAVDYAKLVLAVVPTGRTQTPELLGATTPFALSHGGRERGPELSRIVGGEPNVVDDKKAPAEGGTGPGRIRLRATCGKEPRAIAARQGLAVEHVTDQQDIPLTPATDANPSLKFDDATHERVMMDPEFVEYELPAGPTRIRVRSTKCEPAIEQVVVLAGKTVELAPQLRLVEQPVLVRRPEFGAPSDRFQVVDGAGKPVCEAVPCEIKVPAQSGYQVVWDRGGGDALRAPLPEPGHSDRPAEARMQYRRVTSSLGPALAIGGAAVAAIALPVYLFVADSKTCDHTFASDTRGGSRTESTGMKLSDTCDGTGVNPLSHPLSTKESTSGTGKALLGFGVAGAAVAVAGAVVWFTKAIGHDEFEVRFGAPPSASTPNKIPIRVGVVPGAITGSF